jgi:hypothetical protein
MAAVEAATGSLKGEPERSLEKVSTAVQKILLAILDLMRLAANWPGLFHKKYSLRDLNHTANQNDQTIRRPAHPLPGNPC